MLAAKYPRWNALADSWPQLERTLTGEIGAELSLRVETPRTYKLIRSLLDQARAV